MGKSRVIATIVALKNEYDGTDNFTIVFATEFLKSVEEKHYLLLRNLLTTNIVLIAYNKKSPLES